MFDYVEELTELPQIGGEPPAFFWARDLQRLINGTEQAEEFGFNISDRFGIDPANLTFNEQIALTLAVPPLRAIYGQENPL
jgi:hypothetical protein